LLLAALSAVACGRPPAPTDSGTTPWRASAASESSFVNRVWKVDRSTGTDTGAYYVFLGDGTLLVASAHGTPSVGRWIRTGDTLTLVEEGIGHPAEIVRLAERELALRIHSPGPPLDITFVPAVAAMTDSARPAPSGALTGSTWVLEDIGGAGVIDDARATLEFPEPGKVSGRGSCNRFFGTVEQNGDRLHLRPLGTTRMACPEAVMDQEKRYLDRLQAAERFEVEGTTLRIYAGGDTPALRFTRETR
jgi:heat shock protein HslJ